MSANLGAVAALTAGRGQDWGTPDSLSAWARITFGPFNLDPCARAETAQAPRWFAQDGLDLPWDGRVWMNPPFRNCEQWVEKAVAEVHAGRCGLVVALVPARVDSRWWHRYCETAPHWFVRGRLKFKGAAYNAPFPCAIVLFASAPPNCSAKP
jgi:phage N-6-adenine-methyltransferase